MLTVDQITFPAKEIKAKEETQSLSKGRGLRHSWESPENSESDFTPGKKKGVKNVSYMCHCCSLYSKTFILAFFKGHRKRCCNKRLPPAQAGAILMIRWHVWSRRSSV